MKTLHTIYTSFAKRVAIILTLLLTLGVTSVWGANVTFQRITSTSELTSGAKYLIVYESGKLIFNGSSVATGANGETTTVTISNNTITCDEAYAFTITSSSSSWKITGSNGKSIGHTGSSNSLTTGSYTNTISFSSNNVVIGCNSRTLRCNPNNGSPLFRYYTSGQQAIQLYKQTAPSTFTVTCQSNNANYGSVSPTSVKNVANNTAISANGNTLTVGSTTVTATPKAQDVNYTYTFNNWSGIPSGGKVTADVTVTANFTRTARALTNYRTSCNTQTSVTLDPNGGSGTMDAVTTQNGALTLPKCTFTREGYTFAGWATSASGEVTFADEEVVSNWDADITELYAKWTINQYKVTLNPNYPDGKTGTFTYEAGELVDGNLVLTYDYNTDSKTIAALYTSLTLDGYEFGGWYNAKGSNPGQVSGSKCTTTGNITGDKTYFAQWTKLHTITWSVNGTTQSLSPSSVTNGNTLGTPPTPNLDGICEGKTFVGWTTEVNKNYSHATTAPSLITQDTKPTDDVTYYAVFATQGREIGPVVSEELTNSEITTNITNNSCNYSNSKTYTDGAVDYEFMVYTDYANRPWMQIKANESTQTPHIKISTPGVITQVSMTITSHQNESGGILDITKHKPVPEDRVISLQTATSSGSIVASSTGANISNNQLTIKVDNPQYTTLYLKVDGASRIWGMIVYYADGTVDSYSDYTTSCGQTYTITWNNWDGTLLGTSTVVEGKTPTYTGETPTREADEENTYTFKGWTPTIVAATEDATYTATYTETLRNYTITWKNGETTLETDNNVPYGETPTYNGATPTKAATAQYTYTFKGWTPEVTSVTGDATYTATFTETLRTYTITWKNDDGTTLETDENVPYGTTPSYDSEEPTKTATAQHSYDFNGWTPEVTSVTGDATYTAKYTAIVNIIWMVNGKQEKSTTAPAGTSVTPPAVNTIPCGAVLAGWTDAENGVYKHGTSTLYEGAQPSIEITDNKTFYAVFADRETIIPKLPENIVYWENQKITKELGITATIGDGTMTSNVTLDDLRDRTYYGSISTVAQISLENLNLRDYNNINLSFWARGSAKGTLTIVTDVDNNPIGTVTLTGDERLYIIENIPSNATSITLTYSANSGSLFFGTVKIYENTTAVGTFTKLTAENTNGWTSSDWDGYYLITNDQNNLLALDGNAIGEKSYQLVEAHDGIISSPIKTAFLVSYDEDEQGYSIKGIGDELYLGTANNSISVSKEPIYHKTIGYNQLKNSDKILSWNNSGSKFGFYGSIMTSAPQMYKIMSELSNHRTLCTYNIEYTNLEGATHSNPDTYTAANLPLTFTTPSAREGYTFKGWEPATLGTETRGDQTVTAQWTAHTYSVIFKANGGTGSMDDQEFTYDVEQALSANQFTRVGYTFAGWNDNASGNSTSYTDQQVVKNLSSAKNGQRTLYAQWTANTNTSYVVKHYKEQLDGTYLAEADDTDNYTGTTASSVTPEVKSYEGFTAPSTQTVSIAADGSTVVTYQYTRNSYNLSWDVNSGDDLTGEYTSGSVKYGASITQPNTPTRIGYTFANWSPEVPATMPAGDATYTAQWQLIQYTITWSVGESTTTSTVSVETPLSLPTSPANDALGCCADAFIGWSVYAQPTKEQVFNDVANAPEIDENKTFHAVFATTTLTEGSATATFNEMGYTNAEKVTEIALGDGEGHGDATILFAKEQSASNYPAYYTASGALHAYAKNTITINSTSATSTITNVQFTFATKNDGTNTITANVGTYTNGTWTGSAESVVFTIGGETGHRKITSITVTTQAVEQYTNYVTKCTYGNSPTLGAATVTYNSGDGIDVRCEQTSAMNSAATLTFPNAADLTCPITLTASEGFLISTSKSNDAGYQTSLTVSPYKSGSAQAGKLRTIYVRANATGKTENYNGTITISGGEVEKQTIAVKANVNCQGYTLTLKDHLGNTIGTPISHYEGDIIELPTELEEDACSENYTFDGWSTAPVEYGSLIYNKVSFLYTMPAEDVILYPVYQVNTTADYHRVTSDLGLGDVDGNNWAGDYLIAASDNLFANGSKGGMVDEYCIGGNNSVVDPCGDLDGYVVKNGWGDQYKVAFVNVGEGYYLLQTQDGMYNYITNGATSAGLSTTNSINTASVSNHPLSIIFDEINNSVRITNPENATGLALQWMSTSNSFRFGKSNNPIYLYKKSPLYTSSLICEEVTASDALVTSTAGQTVKVNVPITLTSSLHRTTDITAESDNTHFTITNLSGIEEGNHTLAVHYTPTVTTDGIETANIKIKVNNLPVNTFQVTGRHLPQNFAIAAKVGNNWFALPSQGLNSETTPVGYPVKVDNNDNPTAVTSLPTTAEWALRNVYKVNGPKDRFAANGENLVFVNTENKTLYANNGNAKIQTYAEYTNYATNNPERYEWVPTTTDLTNYTLKNVGRDKDLSINVNATFGTHASNIASNNLRFLPINATYTPFDMQVVEWYPTKVLVQTEVNLTSVSVSATVGSEAVANPIVTKKGGKFYEISGLPLEENPTKILTISYDTYSCSKVIPIIISREEKTVENAPFSTLTKDIYNYSDLVVRDGATLTINGTKQAPDKFVNVTIYPTAKIVVPESKQISVYSLTFFGGIGEIYDGSAYTLNKYGVPQLSLKGTLGKTIPQIDYIMRVDLDQMYQVGVPYDVNLNEVTYWDGTAITLGSQLYVSTYDGDARAKLDWNNTWRWEVNFTEKILKAGVGYTISAEPQFGEPYSILRLPMKNNINSGNTETQKETIAVTAHGMSDENLTDNHKGWNYLSNPYMAAISGAEADSKLVVGYLRETGTGPWEWVDDTYRYVTIPHNDGEDYHQQKFSEAILLPFKSFFLQIEHDGDLSFALASRLNAPMRHLQQQENAPREVEFELLLSNDAQSDNTGLLISEEFTPAYEINADLEKMTGTMSVYTIYNGYQLAYNALSPLNAMEEIPLGYVVPTTGEYTFTLDERGDLEDIEHIYLLDHDSSITTDLMEDIYTFTATEKKNDHRFAISVILKAEEEEETPTQLETLELDSNHTYKFIYQDKMYILRNGVIYDAMGKQVQTINK